ncbi:MAG TPA: SusC/RagA family protein [Alistipes sp.]|nr:SusC/RagA family TonB-linked outer membrane protein [Alistipes onderdonkii]MBS6991213.1 SusC/RagA family TonB-linked outer membrane protein [Alistipes sp.]KAA2386279.1 SusC/RagA family TonB-linked outer membrane protein [Alistipes onderdonkii]KAA2389184.1 SusC/RagA family TonB-linked outer membrane protein [Alistipes onderdonkii]KAA2394756.1 SusC/RagA family TonB-linked outer membrane protein [Alistipes onderdonkii]
MKNQARVRFLLPVLTLVCCLFAGTASAQSVPVTLRVSDAPLEQVLSAIEKQTTYLFVYDKNVDVARRVSIDVKDTPLNNVLNTLFQSSDIAYAVENTSIVLSQKAPAAQPGQPVTVTGKVVDASGMPVIGAAVIIKGTTIGTSTGVDGDFSLQVPPPSADAVLEINYLGYEPIAQAVGSRTNITFTLRESAVDVDAVVVTALGIKRSEKALSYNVQQVNSEDIVANKDVNFINSLSGKVAGVTINSSSGGVGSASKVVMRGQKSISQSSNALYVIDGVPMFTTARDGGTEFASQGTTDPIADINPEDIESMSVLNGAAAAALYGSDAANGAIVVTTKRGKAGYTSVTVSSSTEVMSPFILPDFQNRYGTGDLNSTESSFVRSWGNRLNSSNYMGYNPRDDYFQTGVTGTESVSLSTGTEKNQTYFSAAAVNSRGIVPNNGYDRYNFTFRNTTSFLNDKLKLDVGASYVMQKDRNMTNQGTYNNPLVGAYIFPRGNDWGDIEMYERYDPARRLYTQYWPVGDAGMTMQNPYWINYRNLRENNKDRYMLSAALSYDVLDWLNVSGRIRVDNSSNDYTEKFYASTFTQLTEGSKNGLYGITKTKDKQVYGDVLVNINKTFGENWSLQANVGASISDMRYDAMKVRGPIPDGEITDEKPLLANVFNVQNLSNTSKTKRLQEGWREQTQSVFASVEVGFKNTYFLTLTGRNDWPSQLAGEHSVKSSFFYPSVGASVVLSQLIPEMPKNLSYVKLRASYASVGVAFERYLANPRYSWSESGLNWSTQTRFPIYNLKPERTKSFEVGLTMRFLRHFNLDFTYYNTKTQDQTFEPNISTGSGSSKLTIQSGNVRNRGFEVALGYSNTWGRFSWDSNYTLSANKNKILSLADDVVNPETGEHFSVDQLDMGGLGDARFILREGGTLGDFYSRIDLKRDSNGAVYINEKGEIAKEPVTDVANYIKLGSVLPDANMAWRNDFRWRNFNFGFMVSARLGGVVFSRTQSMLDYYGVSEATAAARDAGGVMINGNDLVDANKWYTAIGGGNSVPQYYTYSATNVRLQEASIGYTIPKKTLGDICEITLSLVGRNLWMIYNKAPFDPETIATTGNYYQGVDYFMSPSMRNIGFNLRVKF